MTRGFQNRNGMSKFDMKAVAFCKSRHQEGVEKELDLIATGQLTNDLKGVESLGQTKG